MARNGCRSPGEPNVAKTMRFPARSRAIRGSVPDPCIGGMESRSPATTPVTGEQMETQLPMPKWHNTPDVGTRPRRSWADVEESGVDDP